MIKIREYTPSDLPEITELFYNTVHTVNAADYDDEQLDAWADGNIDMEKWNKSLESHYSLVAEENGVIAGFGDIDETGYLDRLYVHKDYQGRGIGTAICERLESRVRCKITTHASVTAKPFFRQRGYRVIRKQQVERRGVFLTNFVMEKDYYKTKISITEAESRDTELTEKLVDVWESSVEVFKRTEFDEQGDPYPLLYMKYVR